MKLSEPLVLTHHQVTRDRLVELHTIARQRFLADLHQAHPDPDDQVRAQLEPVLDRWWPHALDRQDA